MQSGALISFEGGEGAGKSTQLRYLAAWLEARGACPVCTREPGGTEAAEAVRELLLAKPYTWSPTAQCMLHGAARAEHVRATIAPARRAGSWVLCDRFVDSTRAYQGYADGVPAAVVAAATDHAVDGWMPDATLVLDVEPRTGLARAGSRGDADAGAGRGDRYHRAVREGFRTLARADPGRCALIDGESDAATVHARVVAAVVARLGLTWPASG